MKTGGIILCGGASSRMGTAKAILPVGDELMLQRVARILREAVEPIVVVAAVGQQVPPLPAEVALVYDTKPNRGPLQGLRDGLSSLPNHIEAAYVTACDVPRLSPDFVRQVIASLGQREIAVPVDDDFRHPLAAAYRRSVLPRIEGLLAGGGRKLQQLLDEADTREVSTAELREVDPDLASLMNCNQPSEYAAALRALGL